MKKKILVTIYFLTFLLFLFASVLTSSIQNFESGHLNSIIMWFIGTPILVHIITIVPLISCIYIKYKH